MSYNILDLNKWNGMLKESLLFCYLRKPENSFVAAYQDRGSQKPPRFYSAMRKDMACVIKVSFCNLS